MLLIEAFYWQLFLISLLLLPAIALMHMLKQKFRGRNRLIWVLIIIFLPFFGPILYFIMGKRYREQNPD